MKPPTLETFFNLASLRQLQCIEFVGDLFKVVAAAIINKPLPVTFNCLNKLTLGWVDMSSTDVLRNIFDMVDCCPYMKELFISSVHSGKNAKKLNYTRIHKLPHLIKVDIRGITGSGVEVQLVEYLLTTAVALERLFYTSCYSDSESQMNLSKVLSEIPRASPKARVVCLT